MRVVVVELDASRPGGRSCVASQSSPKRSTDSSPASRRAVWIASSKRFIAIWRNTAATAPSSAPASRSSRSAGPGARSSSRSRTMFSPKIEAVSASVSGVEKW